MKKKLPIGIQTFSTIREEGFYYVDKTKSILELVDYHYVFLSRPRRFGKSLTLDTIAELFSGNKALFTGLYAQENWDWSQKHPVIRMSFGTSVSFSAELVQKTIDGHLISLEQQFGITPTMPTFVGRLQDIIRHCHKTTGQKVIILVDEYDKPILDTLTNATEALLIRDLLRSLYGVIKDSDAHVRFAMLTGVSRFSKINLFSGLNNLRDISMMQKFSALCGYTQTELETVFFPELSGVDLDKLKSWYNGYNWSGESVYNPFDILLFLDDRQYLPHWFNTGTPTFLIDKMLSEGVNSFMGSDDVATDSVLSSFDVESIDPMALMFQTGYLTIDKVISQFGSVAYTLKYPNKAAEQAYLHNILGSSK